MKTAKIKAVFIFWKKCLTGISALCYYINNETEKGESK